jgi:hypothetical protein
MAKSNLYNQANKSMVHLLVPGIWLTNIPIYRIMVFICLMSLLFSSCIKSYEPQIDVSDAVKFVVTGQVNKGDDFQYVNISTTSSMSKPKYNLVTGCIVTIIDDQNNQFEAIDMKDGNYKAEIPKNELSAGSAFKVDIVASDGTHIVSDFDQLPDCPAIDSLYFELSTLPSDNPNIHVKGIQFYIDLNAENYSSRYFRWEAIETWEFRAVYPIEWIYDGKVHHILPVDYSRKVCWKTTMVNDVFTLSTLNLAQNKYKSYKLHFVDNYSSSRLVYGISLLLRQYSLSKSAFEYWEKVRINSNDQGGLYEKQPLAIKGNMHNMTNPDRQVLGYFGTSTVSSKRIFVKNVENLPLEYNPGCSAESEKPFRTFNGVQPPYPVYLYAGLYGYLIIILPPYCYDCRRDGGDTIKPAFWPY